MIRSIRIYWLDAAGLSHLYSHFMIRDLSSADEAYQACCRALLLDKPVGFMVDHTQTAEEYWALPLDVLQGLVWQMEEAENLDRDWEEMQITVPPDTTDILIQRAAAQRIADQMETDRGQAHDDFLDLYASDPDEDAAPLAAILTFDSEAEAD